MSEARPGPFPTTRWTLILSAQPSPEARRAATAELLALYWRPLYLYARRKGLAPDASEDAVQAVCVRLLERDFVKDLDPARGKLRGYLRACLDHVVVNAHAREAAKRRGGEAVVVPLDREVAEQVLAAAPAEGPESFDREWAECVMGQAMERLEDEFRSGKRGGRSSS
ncbi:MAG: ECF-type sigma factor [Acidobacteriota bacterium]